MPARILLPLLLLALASALPSPGMRPALPTGAALQQQTSPGQIDWKAVEAALGRTGSPQPDGVYRFSLPRSDLQVTVDEVRLKPALALGAWVAFQTAPDGAVAMGDLVLTQNEVEPVLARLQQGGIEQTGIHHHLLRESPRLLYTHIHAHGDPVKIAAAIRAAVALTGTPPAVSATTPVEPFDLDTAPVAKILGRSGRINGGVYQVSVPRSEVIREAGVVMAPAMGLATALNFQPTGGGKAITTGDFVLLGAEVNPVLRILLEHGIAVTSLHNHLLAEEPRLFFMHFWGLEDGTRLARGLRAALDRTQSRSAASQ